MATRRPIPPSSFSVSPSLAPIFLRPLLFLFTGDPLFFSSAGRPPLLFHRWEAGAHPPLLLRQRGGDTAWRGYIGVAEIRPLPPLLLPWPSVAFPLSPTERMLGRRGHGVARSGVGYGLPLQCSTRNGLAARRGEVRQGLAATCHRVDLKF